MFEKPWQLSALQGDCWEWTNTVVCALGCPRHHSQKTPQAAGLFLPDLVFILPAVDTVSMRTVLTHSGLAWSRTIGQEDAAEGTRGSRT